MLSNPGVFEASTASPGVPPDVELTWILLSKYQFNERIIIFEAKLNFVLIYET